LTVPTEYGRVSVGARSVEGAELGMRVLAAILLMASGITHVVLGGTYLLSSKGERFQAQMDAGDLSLVSKDLASAEDRRKEHTAAAVKVGSAGRHDLVISIVLFALAPLQLGAGVFVLRRRAKLFVLSAAGLSAAALVGVMMEDRFTRHGLITLGALVVALLLSLFTRSKALPRTT
jgi:hypothetical protein